MDKIIQLVGMAMRAGKVEIGDRLIPSIQQKKASIVLYSSSCGNNRKKKIKDKCTTYEIPYVEINEADFNQISTRSISSLAIADSGFAKAILKEYKERIGDYIGK